MKVGEYRQQGTVEQLLRFLAQARLSDKTSEKKVRRFGCLSGILVIAAIASFIAASSNESGLLALVGIGVSAVAIGSIIGFAKAAARDLDDRKLDSAIRFLSVIRADVPRAAVLNLRIDFRSYERGGELLRDQRGGGIRQRKYAHDWLDLSCKLLDGTVLRVRAGDRVSRKEKSKRKYTKVKERFIGQVNVHLRLGEKRYLVPGDVAAALKSAKRPVAIQRHAVVQKERDLSVVLSTQAATRVSGRGVIEPDQAAMLNGDTLLAGLLWVFGGVGSSRQRA